MDRQMMDSSIKERLFVHPRRFFSLFLQLNHHHDEDDEDRSSQYSILLRNSYGSIKNVECIADLRRKSPKIEFTL